VVTYSSCLALVYFAATEQRLTLEQITADPRWARAPRAARRHIRASALWPPSGAAEVIWRASTDARLYATVSLRVISGENPLEIFRHRAVCAASGGVPGGAAERRRLRLFGSFDGYDIISFDDQVGAHGSAGGDQVYPFIISAERLGLAAESLEDARDIHRTVLARYAAAKRRECSALGRALNAACAARRCMSRL